MKRLKIASLAFEIFLSISLCFLLTYNLMYNINSKHGEKMVFTFNHVTTKVISDSMEPFIMTNDYVLIKKVKPDDEIIVSKHKEETDIGIYVYIDRNLSTEKEIYVIHRCVGITPDGKYIFQGDNNETTDPWEVAKEDIVGEFVKIQNNTLTIQNKLNIIIISIDVLFIVNLLILNTTQKNKEKGNK